MVDDQQPDQTESRFAANLRAARERAGLSQAALAARMVELGWPFHQQTIARIEGGTRAVRLGEAVALGRAVSSSADALTRPRGLASEAFGILDAARGARASWAEASRQAALFRDQRKSLGIRIERAVSEGHEDELADEIARSRPVLGLSLREALKGEDDEAAGPGGAGEGT